MRRTLFTRSSAVAMGLILSIVGLFDVPRRALSWLSQDGTLHATTAAEASVIRGVCLAVGVASFALSFVVVPTRIWLEQLPTPPPLTTASKQLHIAVALCSAGLIAGALVTANWAASSPDPVMFKIICEENGVWESLTALSLFASSILFARAARGSGPRWPALSFCLGAFVLCMEEVSWGQHWFGWSTPEGLADLNTQNETNLHNIGGYWSHQIIMIATFAWLALVPICFRIFWDVRTAFRHFRIPLAPISLVPLGLVAPMLDERPQFYLLWGGPYPWRLSEARELALGLGLFFTAWVFASRPSDS